MDVFFVAHDLIFELVQLFFELVLDLPDSLLGTAFVASGPDTATVVHTAVNRCMIVISASTLWEATD